MNAAKKYNSYGISNFIYHSASQVLFIHNKVHNFRPPSVNKVIGDCCWLQQQPLQFIFKKFIA